MVLFREPSEIWGDLSISSPAQGGLLAANWDGGFILLDIDALGMPLLLVEVGDGDQTVVEDDQFATYGINVKTRKLRLDERATNCVVLGARGKSDEEAFLRMADLIVAELVTSERVAPGSHTDFVFAVLRNWIDFWRKVGGGPSAEKIVGLIGELLVILDWNALEGLSHESWGGPIGAPQDFRSGTTAIEVKVTQSRTGPRVHRISSVLQLDDANLDGLYLVSYRLHLHANGSRGLFQVADSILKTPEFADPNAIEKLNRAISEVGVTRGSSKKYTMFDILDCRLYAVRDDFPRLLEVDTAKSSMVFDVKYSVDLTGADRFILADQPIDLSSLEDWNA